ncbi:MAG TPA: hypothetical protein ENK44_05950 [Caldithrix abyssi]|uniref:Cytochrome c domain-containing protein n=1 Tax=Caldithrix abyssi TaxID=187145 RepID=A0A7V4WUD6_CALAY|nr:hypothetical protein [Caldithrix abyssi]
MYKKSFILFLFLLLYGCTQLLEEENAGKNIFVGDDGCVYCHTNKERLKLLAPEEDTGGGGGGGG